MLVIICIVGVGTAFPQQSKESPVEKVKKIGDKLIRETPLLTSWDLLLVVLLSTR
ncbi:hypothetical protein SFC43_21320 [Bacteroides sp. CR5/BHMF/2]|nr:hypothetical protein [Bacteroides sp. CR5/BHMF/2]